jgi:hypothetical protein
LPNPFEEKEPAGGGGDYAVMPIYVIRVVNATFSGDEEQELADIDAARREGLKGAFQIGVDEVLRGTPFFGAEVRIEQNDELLNRFVVSVGASPLQ